MTPHERAAQICPPNTNSVLHGQIVMALIAQTADLRALLAEQAARADRAVVERDEANQLTQEQYKEFTNNWLEPQKADVLMQELDTLRAQVAQMREALEDINKGLGVVHDGFGTMPSVAAIEQAQEVCVLASQTIDAALSTPASDWLEQVKADAKADGLDEAGKIMESFMGVSHARALQEINKRAADLYQRGRLGTAIHRACNPEKTSDDWLAEKIRKVKAEVYDAIEKRIELNAQFDGNLIFTRDDLAALRQEGKS